MDQRELQEKYFQSEILKSQLNVIAKERQSLQEKLMEIELTKATLSEIDGVEKGTTIWSSLGAGVFVKTSLEDKKKFMVNLGADVMCEKSMKEVLEILDKQMGDIQKADKELLKNAGKISEELSKIDKELAKLVSVAQEHEQKLETKNNQR